MIILIFCAVIAIIRLVIAKLCRRSGNLGMGYQSTQPNHHHCEGWYPHTVIAKAEGLWQSRCDNYIILLQNYSNQ